MITKLVKNDVEIGQIGEDDGDLRHPQPGAIIDGPGGEILTVKRILEKGLTDQAVVEVEDFTF